MNGSVLTGPGSLEWADWADCARPVGTLVAPPVATALAVFPDEVLAAPIDPELADTAAFCARYGVLPEDSANCVVIAGRRGETVSYAACVVLATTRADVNGVVRRRLDARKASFASVADAVELSGMEFGGITPIGLPESWPVLVDAAVLARAVVVVGSGLRRSKLALAASSLAKIPNAEIVESLANSAQR